jgi:hypothetical protein
MQAVLAVGGARVVLFKRLPALEALLKEVHTKKNKK